MKKSKLLERLTERREARKMIKMLLKKALFVKDCHAVAYGMETLNKVNIQIIQTQRLLEACR